MYFEFQLEFRPFQIGSIRRFVAPDPWKGQALAGSGVRVTPAEWGIEEFVIENVKSPNPAPTLRTPSQIGIVSYPDGRYHILPRALVDLWEKGQIADTALPAALRRLEPSLEDVDFDTPPQRMSAIIWSVFAIPCLAYYLLSLSSARMASDFSGVAKWLGIVFAALAAPFIVRLISGRRRAERQKRELTRWLTGAGPAL